jgi:hypothetical protein
MAFHGLQDKGQDNKALSVQTNWPSIINLNRRRVGRYRKIKADTDSDASIAH